MANNPKYSDVAADAEGDALAPLFNSGYLRVYDGAQPATADDPVTTQHLLAELRFGNPGVATSVNGVLTFAAITQDGDADYTAAETWCRLLESDGTTVIMDCSAGAAGCDINFGVATIVQHSIVQVSSLVLTLSKG